ncbi:MAG: FHA domain-containing protein, partial [Candidatus Promineifilaceae bacterium]
LLSAIPLQQILQSNRAHAVLVIEETPAELAPQKQVPIVKFPFTLGRAGCDFVISEPRVSRQHAKIVQHGDKFYLIDLNSSNYTFLAGQQIKPGELNQLQPNVTIRLGRRTVLRFEV